MNGPSNWRAFRFGLPNVAAVVRADFARQSSRPGATSRTHCSTSRLRASNTSADAPPRLGSQTSYRPELVVYLLRFSTPVEVTEAR